MDIAELFKEHNDEYLKFGRIKNKRSSRWDLHAFLVLDELFPCDGNMNIISGAESERIELDIDTDNIEKLTEDQIVELLRCGVLYDDDKGSLYMNV